MKPAHDPADAAEVELIDFSPVTDIPRLDLFSPPRTRTRADPAGGGDPHD